MFLGIVSSACVQVASLGIALLLDKDAKPVFSRWFGYYNIWVAMMWVPVSNNAVALDRRLRPRAMTITMAQSASIQRGTVPRTRSDGICEALDGTATPRV